LRENGNASGDSGFEAARVTSREPKVVISLEHELKATFDFFGKFDGGIKVALAMHMGTVLEKQAFFFADFLEIDNLPIGDTDGITSLDLEGICTGKANGADDEWEIILI